MDERIIFLDHARQQLKFRSIKQSEVRAVIRDPDRTTRQADGRIRVAKEHGTMVIVVIYERMGQELLVITAFQSSKQRKYLP